VASNSGVCVQQLASVAIIFGTKTKRVKTIQLKQIYSSSLLIAALLSLNTKLDNIPGQQHFKNLFFANFFYFSHLQI
jgi:hypothetical protein